MSEIDRRPLSKVKNTAGYCLKWINSMQTRARIDGILSGHGWNRVLITRIWNRVMNIGTGSGYPVPATN